MLIKVAAITSIAILTIAGADQAQSRGEPNTGPRHGLQYHRHASARTMPPEVRYRDPRYRPPRRHTPHFGPPADLIQAYLPRTTETPMYNEPPSRFPQR